jgi:hypothetical protein
MSVKFQISKGRPDVVQVCRSTRSEGADKKAGKSQLMTLKTRMSVQLKFNKGCPDAVQVCTPTTQQGQQNRISQLSE